MEANADYWRKWAENKRAQRDGAWAVADRLTDELADKARELRALADELDPPTEPFADGVRDTLPTPADLARFGVPDDGRLLGKDRPADSPLVQAVAAKHAAPESVEYEPDLKDGRLTLRPTGRSWPAACEMCGAGNGQPCQAVSE